IVMGPRAILADEPTGNLDSRTSGEVHDVMRWINRTLGVTFIIATHDERLAGKADRIVRIADGLIVQ
ncbi:MAG: lipoprotein-releasing system ATP-binding protein LolD, partial [Candidatus Schekmanbacteria bacterium]|nr:lipoprotein-releasing system ATP-binding protein LolD [Candidatus Schekmanbacteria bacterium]